MTPGAAARITRSLAAFRPLADGLLSVVLASRCVSCRGLLATPAAGIVCAGCWEAIPPIAPPFCVVCSDPLVSWRVPMERCPQCRLARPHISAGATVSAYDGPLRSILQAFKYDGRRSLAAPLSRLMRLRGRGVLAGADCVVPVPLHWRRHWRRGFNQALELTRELGLPVQYALRRRRSTRTQADLPAAARQRNVRDAFDATGRARLAGLRVVLVDDVSTTGATLEACARVLMAAGAAEVRTLTAARVVTRSPGARQR